MPQSYVLSVVAMRDSGALPAAKVTTMNYSCIELSASVLIVTYGILALLAYFMAIGLGEGQLEATQDSVFRSRWLYFQVCITYLAGAACVTHGTRLTSGSPHTRIYTCIRITLPATFQTCPSMYH